MLWRGPKANLSLENGQAAECLWERGVIARMVDMKQDHANEDITLSAHPRCALRSRRRAQIEEILNI
jgi:hypothetical protein